jgi:hypothetical protein
MVYATGYKKLFFMRAELNCIIENFPEMKDRIAALFGCSDEFQKLCHDYFLCNKSLYQWKLNPNKDRERISEYEELKIVLEAQLFKYINEDGLNKG